MDGLSEFAFCNVTSLHDATANSGAPACARQCVYPVRPCSLGVAVLRCACVAESLLSECFVMLPGSVLGASCANKVK